MNVTLESPRFVGGIGAIPSKSHAHRLLICAAVSDKPTMLHCPATNSDIDATARCLRALGAKIVYDGEWFSVTPIDRTQNQDTVTTLDCGESGSTLRFMVPVVLALGRNVEFKMEGRLPERPMSPLREVLIEHGAYFSEVGSNPLSVSGKLVGGEFVFDGGVSSQFATGLLLAAPLLGEGATVRLIGKVESRPYIDLTLKSMKEFGVSVCEDSNTFTVEPSVYASPEEINVEGDWSNAAFMLCAGVLSDDGVTVRGLDTCSTQGDKEIIAVLDKFGADVNISGSGITVRKKRLCGITVDASDIPDLVPIISVVASVAEGESVIENCSRLRLKESDRLETVCEMINSVGGEASICGDSLHIIGKARLCGGRVNSYNDHRIAMSASILAATCENSVTVLGADAVNKSYPGFFRDLEKITK